ncbi:uncharacterized protein [Cicer arietinum]|uniref:uncharacterized protein n=1 Tax=Cicer arietinum TaxID=3827 RepID=UPI003CC56CE5
MNGEGFPSNLPILDGKNWERWSASKRSLLGAQEVFEIVQDDYEQLGANPTERQQTIFKDCKKKDCKALFYIQQSVDSNNFERISKTITNQMKANGEVMTEVMIIEKILRTLTQRYDHIVMAIEESKNLDTMKLKYLQSSLEAHELRVKERDEAHTQTQALEAQINRKSNQDGVKNKKWKGKSNGYQKQDQDEEAGGSRSQQNSDNKSKKPYEKKKFDKRKVQCYNCQKCGHFADEADPRKYKEMMVKLN